MITFVPQFACFNHHLSSFLDEGLIKHFIFHFSSAITLFHSWFSGYQSEEYMNAKKGFRQIPRTLIWSEISPLGRNDGSFISIVVEKSLKHFI